MIVTEIHLFNSLFISVSKFYYAANLDLICNERYKLMS
jgi:hypothetical protein